MYGYVANSDETDETRGRTGLWIYRLAAPRPLIELPIHIHGRTRYV